MKAAIVGGGLIGGGWAARFLLSGWDVAIYDNSVAARVRVEQVLANARRTLPLLYDQPLPPEGNLTFDGVLETVIEDADWIQESVPERVDVKFEVYARIGAAMRPDAIVGSSTSGFKPSDLAAGFARPGQFLVVHPFNPVYLLPLVELVPSQLTAGPVIDAASETLSSLGMYPLLVRREIDGFIGNRLQEAMWREALWMIRDGVATTEEIDDAVRFGFGLRTAQMGQFETYRIAGGARGMSHFIAQFGPHLKSPLSRLTDVPELDDELVGMITEQSDAQSGHASIDALEALRDDNLVGIIRALKQTRSGAGRVVLEHEARFGRSNATQDAGGSLG